MDFETKLRNRLQEALRDESIQTINDTNYLVVAIGEDWVELRGDTTIIKSGWGPWPFCPSKEIFLLRLAAIKSVLPNPNWVLKLQREDA